MLMPWLSRALRRQFFDAAMKSPLRLMPDAPRHYHDSRYAYAH